MRRLIFPLRTSPEAEAGDDVYPALRGWPELGLAYNPGAPGTIFNDWTTNVGIRTSSAPFCVSVDFSFTSAVNGIMPFFLWKPPTGRQIAITHTVIDVQNIYITGRTTPLNPIIFIAGHGNTGLVATGGVMITHTIPTTDPSWLVSGSDCVWGSNQNGTGGVSNFAAGPGSTSATSPGEGGQEGLINQGYPSVVLPPWKNPDGVTVQDRFVLRLNSIQGVGPTTYVIGTVHFIGMFIS